MPPLSGIFLLNDYMAQDKIIEEVTSGEYKYGFTTDVQTDIIGKGLNEDVIRTISMKKGEPSGTGSTTPP